MYFCVCAAACVSVRGYVRARAFSHAGARESLFSGCSLVSDLHVGLLATVGVHTVVAPVDVDTGLPVGAVVRARLTLVHV